MLHVLNSVLGKMIFQKQKQLKRKLHFTWSLKHMITFVKHEIYNVVLLDYKNLIYIYIYIDISTAISL